jgi:TolB-like protein/tRNA A-37 threonylcarbamoyl transferase component Bud32
LADLLARLQSALADRYTIEREIGAGGMATVYLAHDQKLGRTVALKVLRPELAAALGGDRFLREIEIAAKLAHPHILALHDCGAADGLLYYTMPFVEGESLRDRLTREKQLPLEDALQIAREVADALGYAHALGLVHRDIKPENILFQAGHAVVSDFGIAKAIAVAGSQRLTETGLAIGTPQYMSPEQAAGEADLDGRSDLYSLGCVLYEMLSGETPYTGPTAQAILAKKLSEPLPRISVVREAVPAGIEAALNKALARTPADRFATAAQFAAALAHPEVAGSSLPVPHLRWWRRRAVRLAAAAVVLVVVAAAIVVGRWLRPGAPASHYPRTAIAVLPLENLSAEGPQAFFAPGLHDELLTQLSKVAVLSVRARTSVMGYAGTTKPMRTIADELAVGTIVEGSVQVVGNRLRVNVQLIDAATDRHVWAEQYDRTLVDAFAVQADIAQRIAEAVGGTLTRAEAGAIAAAPTANAEAYRLYLQGRQYFLRPGYLRQNYDSAQQLYERALVLDPGFALAHAALSVVDGFVYFFKYDPGPQRAERWREEAETALHLAPGLPQAHAAMGLAHFWGRRDYQRALEEFGIARRGLPKDAWLSKFVGYVHRRAGNWDEALVAFEEAAQLDPRDADLIYDLGAVTYAVLHRYAEAVRACDQTLSLAPDYHDAAVLKGWVYAWWRGRLDTLRTVLSRLPSDFASSEYGTRAAQQVQLFLWARQPDSLLHVLAAARAGLFEAQFFFVPSTFYAAWAHRLRGDHSAARAAFDSARVLLDSVMKERPDDWRVHGVRGLALAGLDRRAEALREADWLRQSVAYRKDALDRPFLAQARAQILAEAGDADAGLDEIQRLLAGPSYVTVHTLRLDPRWDPIRHDPRFQALLTKYAGR